VTAAREVVRRHSSGRPEVVRVTGRNETGRTLDVTGNAVNGVPFYARPNLLSCVTALQWHGRWGDRSTSFYGQDQDAWSFSLYRDQSTKDGSRWARQRPPRRRYPAAPHQHSNREEECI
jgi:hypothetical protein